MWLFANSTKHRQYIYQIEDLEMLINNPGSIPQNSPPFGRKATNLRWNLTGKVAIYREWWVQLESSQDAEFKNGGDGRKMATTAMATRDHAPPTGCVARHLELKLKAWCHWELLFLLVRRVQLFGVRSTVNIPCCGCLLEREEKKKKKEEDSRTGKK